MFDFAPGTVTEDHLWLEEHALARPGVRVRTLHPEFARRLRRLLEAVYAVTGYRSAVILVGERLRSEGISLWNRYNLPKGHPNKYPYVVAPPFQNNGTVAGTNISVIGSYHFIQSDGWAHAADVIPAGKGSYGAIHKRWRLLGGELNGGGLGLYVASEPWHWQWLRRAGILPAPGTVTSGPVFTPAQMEAHDMLLLVDPTRTDDHPDGEAVIVGLPYVVDVTTSPARAEHGAAFEAAGRKMSYKHGGSITRKGYDLPENRADW